MKYLLLVIIYASIGRSAIAQKESEYTRFWQFQNGLARVERDGLIGFIDTNFNEVIPCHFYWANNFYKNGHGLASIQDSSKLFGFINRKGDIVVEPKYEMVYFFEDSVDLIYVFDGKYYGWMNQYGKEIIPCELDQTVSTPEHFHNGKVRVKKDGLYGQMDQFGNTTIDCKYLWINGFDNDHGFPESGLLVASGPDRNDYYCINQKTRATVKLNYSFAGEFQNGFATVEKDDLYGFIDTSLEIKIPCIYTSVGKFSNGRAAVRNADNKWGIIDTKGNLILDYTYDYIEEFFDGKALVRLNGKEQESQDRFSLPTRVGDKFGYIDVQGKPLTPIKYEHCFGFKNNSTYSHIALKKNGKYILTNNSFERVSRKKYKSISFSDKYFLYADVLINPNINYCLGFRNDQFYPIDQNGDELTKQGSNRMFFFVENISMYQDKEGLCGFINSKGDVIIPAEYTYFNYCYFNNGTVVVKKKGKKGIINKSGLTLVPFKYDTLYNFSNGFAFGKRDGNYYFINLLGEEVLCSASKK